MRRYTIAAAAGVLVLTCGWAMAQYSGTSRVSVPVPAASPLEQLNADLVQLAAKISPSAVLISVEAPAVTTRRVSGIPGVMEFTIEATAAASAPARGSGVILTPDGYILTSADLFRSRADAKVKVTLSDDRVLDAKLVGRDLRSNLAVLKVEAKDLSAATLAESSPPLGSLVVAVGDAAGAGRSLSLGMVSASNRAMTAPASIGSATLYPNLLQITNPVTSSDIGGPVADVKGRVVGILHSSMTGRPVVAQAVTTVPGAQMLPGAPANPALGGAPNVRIFDLMPGGQPQVSNVSFATPVETLRFVFDALRKGEKVPWGYLGLYFGAEKDKGLLVVNVMPQSPAAEAGIVKGDILTSLTLAGKEKMAFTGETRDSAALSQAVGAAGAGTEAKLGILRDDKPQEITVKLGAAPEMQEPRPLVMRAPENGQWTEQAPPFMRRPWLGVELETTPAGAKIREIVPGSPAEQHGLRVGDLIVKVGDANVKTAEDVTKQIEKLTPGRKVALTLLRGRETLTADVTPGLQTGAAPMIVPNAQGNPWRLALERQPWLGIEAKDTEQGLVVTRVFGGSPADDAGIKLGDVILKMNGKDVAGLDNLRDTVRSHKPGDEITVTIRRDGKESEIKAKLGNLGDRNEDAQP